MGLFRRKEDLEQLKIPKPKKAYVLVFDDERGISAIHDMPVGKPWQFGGDIIYCATWENGHRQKLIPYDPLAEWRQGRKGRKTYTPEDLYNAIDWREVGPVYRLGGNLMQKINLGLMVVLVGILCFFVYVMFSNITGG